MNRQEAEDARKRRAMCTVTINKQTFIGWVGTVVGERGREQVTVETMQGKRIEVPLESVKAVDSAQMGRRQ